MKKYLYDLSDMKGWLRTANTAATHGQVAIAERLERMVENEDKFHDKLLEVLKGIEQNLSRR